MSQRMEEGLLNANTELANVKAQLEEERQQHQVALQDALQHQQQLLEEARTAGSSQLEEEWQQHQVALQQQQQLLEEARAAGSSQLEEERQQHQVALQDALQQQQQLLEETRTAGSSSQNNVAEIEQQKQKLVCIYTICIKIPVFMEICQTSDIEADLGYVHHSSSNSQTI